MHARCGFLRLLGMGTTIATKCVALPWALSICAFAQPTLVDLNSLDGQNGFTMHANQSRDNSGVGHDGIGDFNGDGLDDFAVAARNNRANGKVLLVFGRTNGFPAVIDESYLDGDRGILLHGIDRGETIQAVTSAGDVNGDGFDDLLYAGYLAPPNRSGRAYLVFGGPGPWPASMEAAELNGTNGVVFPGPVEDGYTGQALAGLCDVNGDGFDDFLITTPRSDQTVSNPVGRAHVVFGSTNAWPATMDLAALDGTNGFSICTEAIGSAGYPAKIDDLDRDGLAEILVCESSQEVDGTNGVGEAYLFYGRRSWPAKVEAAQADSVFQGSGESAVLGLYGLAMDFNGDGWRDVVLSEHGNDELEVNAGAAQVFLGGPTRFDAIERAVDLDGATGFSILGVHAEGFMRCGQAGDVDGDGFDDLQLGAFGADTPFTDAGQAYFVYGGPGPYPDSVSVMDLTERSGGWMMNGKTRNDRFASYYSSAGDINGDGFDEFAVAAYWADPISFDEGETYVFLGAPRGLNLAVEVDCTWTSRCTGAVARIDVVVRAEERAAGDVEVHIPLQGTVLLGATSPASCTTRSDTAVCRIGAVTPGTNVRFSVRVGTADVCGDGPWRCQAEVLALPGESNLADNISSSVVALPGPPPLVVHLTRPEVLAGPGYPATNAFLADLVIRSGCVVTTEITDSDVTLWTNKCDYAMDRTYEVRDICGNMSNVLQRIVFSAYDYDADGIADKWETKHALDPLDSADAVEDPDGDECDNFSEWVADTDPNDGNDCFAITNKVVLPARVYFPSSSNRVYTLQSSTNLVIQGWQDVPGAILVPGTGGAQMLVGEDDPRVQHFRVLPSLPPLPIGQLP